MDLILSAIVDWLGSEHGSGRRPMYGWQSVVLVAIWIGGWITARELRAKRKSLNRQLSNKLAEHELSAKALLQTGNTTVTHSAKLKNLQDSYVVEVKITSPAAPDQLIHERLASLSDVEIFLRRETMFVLADFTATAHPNAASTKPAVSSSPTSLGE